MRPRAHPSTTCTGGDHEDQWAKLGGVLGIVYCIAGFFLIFLGWNGAASNDRVPAQIPYVDLGRHRRPRRSSWSARR